MRLDGWRFQSHPWSAGSLGEKRRWRLSSVAKGQWFHQSCLCHEASMKTQKDKVQRTSMLVTTRRRAQRGRASSFQHSLPCALLHWLFICILDNILQYPSHKLLSVSKWFSEFCEAPGKLVTTEEGVVGTSDPQPVCLQHGWWAGLVVGFWGGW